MSASADPQTLSRTNANLLGAVTLLAVVRDHVKYRTALLSAAPGELEAFAHALGQVGDLRREILPFFDRELEAREWEVLRAVGHGEGPAEHGRE